MEKSCKSKGSQANDNDTSIVAMLTKMTVTTILIRMAMVKVDKSNSNKALAVGNMTMTTWW